MIGVLGHQDVGQKPLMSGSAGLLGLAGLGARLAELQEQKVARAIGAWSNRERPKWLDDGAWLTPLRELSKVDMMSVCSASGDSYLVGRPRLRDADRQLQPAAPEREH
jgi:hypothetical protein